MDERQMTMPPVFIAGVLLLGALILWLSTRAQRRLGGLPAGELIYSDNVTEDCPVLVSERYGLRGKPDSLVRNRIRRSDPGRAQEIARAPPAV